MVKKRECAKQEPLVSAIITTKNRLHLLKRAIKSVYNQTYKNIEVIVVDDASHDGTEEWCSAQQFKYIRIPYEESKGGNHARNLGADNANGEYLAFLDDDDYWLKEKIKYQVKMLEESGNEVVHCWHKLEIIGEGNSVVIKNCPLSNNYYGKLSKRILYQITILTSAMMIKRNAFFEVGKFDEQCKYWQEYELTIRLAQRKPFDLVRNFQMVYRINTFDENRLTNKYNEWMDAVQYIYAKHRNLYSRLNIFQFVRTKVLFWRDKAMRLERVGLRIEGICKYRNLINIPFRIYDKIKHYLKK